MVYPDGTERGVKEWSSSFEIAFDDEKIQRLYMFQSALYDTDRIKINGVVRKQVYQLALNLAIAQGGIAILEYDPDGSFRMETVRRAYALITAFTRAPDYLVVHDEGNKFIVKIRTDYIQCNWVINKQKNFLEVTTERCGQGSTPYDTALYKIAHMPLSAQGRRELAIFERNMLEVSSSPWIQSQFK